MGRLKELEDLVNDSESCMLAACINHSKAAEIARNLLWVQQHRGEAGAGIVSSKKKNLFLHKESGLVREVFPETFDFKKKLPGRVAIGHGRYPTRGSIDQRCNIQPLVFKDTKYGQIAIAHNGQLIDEHGYKKKLLKKGAVFQSNSDSELLVHLICKSKEKKLEDAVAEAASKVPCAYSLLIMTKSKVIAVRDKYGVRPLAIGKMGKSYLLASEDGAFEIYEDENAKLVRSVRPGEMVVFDKRSIKGKKGFRSIQYTKPHERWCIFEGIYFSDPRSSYNGYMHEDFRQECGKYVYLENKKFFDKLIAKYRDNVCVIPILDSGKQGGIGFEKASGVPYKEYFMRRHNAPKSSGRSFTAAEQKERELRARMKLNLRKKKVRGKAVITVDDSNVRGTTARENNRRLRKAGAEYIVNVFLSPMITHPCNNGMDHQTYKELVSYRRQKDPDSIADYVGADKVIYLSLEGLLKLNQRTYKAGICTGCFGGQYPVKPAN